MLLKLKNRKIHFYVSLASLVVFLVTLLTGLFLWNSQRESSAAAVKMADRLFDEITGRVEGKFHFLLGSVSIFTDSGANMPNMMKEPVYDGLSHESLEYLIKSVDNFNYIFSVYIGYSNGDFLQVIPTRNNPLIFSTYAAPEETHMIIRSISRDYTGKRMQYWRFLDKNRHVVGAKTDENPKYDPRKRPWYLKGLKADTSTFTDPYIFYSSKEPGVTCSRHILGKGGVLGMDISLSNFSKFLQNQAVSENGRLFLFDQSARIIAHPYEPVVKILKQDEHDESQDILKLLDSKDSHDPVVRSVVKSFQEKTHLDFNKTTTLNIDNQDYLVRISNIGYTSGIDQIICIAAPVRDFTGHIRRMETRIFIFTFMVLLIVVPAVIWFSRTISESLMLLADEAQKIQEFDFSESKPFTSVISEIHALIQAFSIMKVTIRQRTDALVTTQKKLETLVEQGIALAAEQDINTLVEMIFLAAKELSVADGGILYLKDEKNHLKYEIIKSDSLGIESGGTKGSLISYTPVPIHHPETGEENHYNVASHSFLTGETITIKDVYDSKQFDLKDIQAFDKKENHRTESLLAVPLKPRQGDALGVILLINHIDKKTGDVHPFNHGITGFVEALAAQAAIALDNRNLVLAQLNLFNSFVQLLAGTIDAKSPYTGGHCERVPVIAGLLAEAASDVKDGPFKDFAFNSDDEWREFRVAAWLHDCGKVTTPDFVVDKATKLETNYNRIHEIRTRVEVLLRDAEIDYYRKLSTGKYNQNDLKEELNVTKNKLIEEFAFIAECNIGGEDMSDDKIERIREIASRPWTRHLDDTLGLSHDELQCMKKTPSERLPAIEYLLSDKAEHIVQRDPGFSFNDAISGFNMIVPDLLYNKGEIYNLSIQKGTLTEEERFKINEHIIQTIIMLEKLPFPKNFARVPEYAGSHHETMLGSGYPRRLTKNDMSIPARIMAIADIFEALTASDRPYKKAKTLNDALRIMSLMRNDSHIDSELFDLFLTSDVFNTYAEKFLPSDQLDDVDITQYLSV